MGGPGRAGVSVAEQPAGRPFLRGRLRDIPALRREVEAARAAGGTPRSELLGRQRRAVTSYEYDDATGRLTRSVTVWDPLWTDDDRELLLALQQEESEECGGCGRQISETTDPASRGAYDVRRHRCEACVVLEAEQDNDSERGRSASRGVKYQVVHTGVVAHG